MILIDYKGLGAIWDHDTEWIDVKDNQGDFVKMLNSNIPEEIHDVDAVFRKGGIEGIIIKHYTNFLGKEFKVIQKKVTPAPIEEDGKDF